MASYYKVGKTYAVSFRFKGGPREYIYGIKSEKLAQQAKAKKDLEEQLARAGLIKPDPHSEKLAAAERKSISAHIDDFEKDILARGKTERHAENMAAHARRLMKMARIQSVDQIALEPVQQALGRLHTSKKLSPRTCNAGRQAVGQFERFLKRTHKVRNTVLYGLARYNEQEDVRRQRRAMTPDELEWLLTATRTRRDLTAQRCGIGSVDRAMLYALGVGTGFRRAAMLSLTKASFFVAPDTTRPFVRLAAKFNKKRRNRDQSIRRDLADQLHAWLAKKPDTGTVWRPSKGADLSHRFRRDMEVARAAWLDAAPDAAERKVREASTFLKYVFHDGTQNVYADFHGLRHTGITMVVRHAGLRVGQAWADHSTPVLTARYAHVEQSDLVNALDGLPAVRPPTPTPTPASPAQR